MDTSIYENISISSNNVSRNYGIDLLRILSMFGIIILHITVRGGLLEANTQALAQKLTLNLINMFVVCGTNCYALISGYVNIYKNNSYKSIIMLWLSVLFYCLLYTSLFYFFIPDTVHTKEWLQAFFPVTSDQYWFFTCYFVLYLFIPILNCTINNMPPKQLMSIILLLFIFLSILHRFSILLTDSKDVLSVNDGFSPWWLIFLYLIGGTIRKYNLFCKIKPLVLLLCFLVFTLIEFSFLYLFVVYNPKIKYHVCYQTPTILLSGIFLLLFFIKIEIDGKFIKLIKYISSLTFGIYLAHVHPLIFQYLIKDLFKSVNGYSVLYLIISIFKYAIIIFTISSLIEIVRKYIFKILQVEKLVNKLSENINIFLSSGASSPYPSDKTFS